MINIDVDETNIIGILKKKGDLHSLNQRDKLLQTKYKEG